MLSHSEVHGGEVDAAADAYGIPRDQWLDLSTGINPHAYPLPELAPEYWHRLPDAALDAWLREAAAACYGVADPAHVIPAPGSQAVIAWLPWCFETRVTVAVLGPTYREHAAAWARAGHRVVEVETLAAVPADAQALIAVNPNNPDGRLHDPQQLLAAASGRILIVDEAFADLAPECSLASRAGHGDLVVLRSAGKFYGLAGMRLGFALTGERFGTPLRQRLGPWAVSGPTAAVGAVALADEAWARGMRIRLMASAGRLDGLLIRAGLQITGGTALFRLTALARAAELFEHLARAAILVRRFADRPQWLRIGLPGDDGAFERLGAALSSWRLQAALPVQPAGAATARRRPERPPGMAAASVGEAGH
jgi:cobalamin biosynthetic protein CobC